MGYLFRKRVKLFPGVGFNLSKRGIRTSFGGKDLTIDIKDEGMTIDDHIADRCLDLSYRATPPNPDNLASRSISLMGWALLFLAVLEGIVLWLRE
jgi:hypothetical protein